MSPRLLMPALCGLALIAGSGLLQTKPGASLGIWFAAVTAGTVVALARAARAHRREPAGRLYSALMQDALNRARREKRG